ncbi:MULTISPECIES: hypothetical protein [unclassified Streptomyces]|uniref:hypothetical protein n=1 Tax=unclassified Streptomyces TaxID=2593676 RepID=UPI00068B56CB|nr:MULTISPECIES: hypothetical protein [unclassified Streptomyces]
MRKRLQDFPAALLNKSTPAKGGDLPQAGQISLDRPVKDVPACDFFSAQRLVCDTDQGRVFQVDLDHAIDGEPSAGKVTDELKPPKISKYSGAYEAEGFDHGRRTGTPRASMFSL